MVYLNIIHIKAKLSVVFHFLRQTEVFAFIANIEAISALANDLILKIQTPLSKNLSQP